MDAPVKLGLVGFGEWGRNYFRTMENVRLAELSIICKRDPSTVPMSVSKAVPVTSSLRQVARIADGVVVVTPPSTHREIACSFLEAGIPVLLEKPVAETVEDAEAIFGAAERGRTHVLVNNTHLFSPSFLAMKRAVESWDPVRIRSEGGNSGPFRGYSSLLDYGPHDVAMAMAVFGSSPDGAEVFRTESEAGEIYNVWLYYGDSVADLTVGNGMASKRRYFEVSCGAKVAAYDDLVRRDKFVLDGCPVKTVLTPPMDEAVYMFARSIRHWDRDWRFSPGFNLDIMRILTLPPS